MARGRGEQQQQQGSAMDSKNCSEIIDCILIPPFPHHYHHTHNFQTLPHQRKSSTYSSARQAVAVAAPVPPSTVFLPSTHSGPRPNNLLITVVVSSAQPLQLISSVCVLGGTVIVQPKGAVEVMTLVQVGEAEQAVTVVVVFVRVVGMAQRTF